MSQKRALPIGLKLGNSRQGEELQNSDNYRELIVLKRKNFLP